jgi:integrase/recombinase XerD
LWATKIDRGLDSHWLKMYNLRQTQYVAGHRFKSSTEVYLVNDLDDLQEEIIRFQPIG